MGELEDPEGSADLDGLRDPEEFGDPVNPAEGDHPESSPGQLDPDPG